MIGFLANLKARFGVRNDDRLRVFGFKVINLLWLEHLMHGTKAFPQDHLGIFDLVVSQAAVGFVKVPDDHLF